MREMPLEINGKVVGKLTESCEEALEIKARNSLQELSTNINIVGSALPREDRSLMEELVMSFNKCLIAHTDYFSIHNWNKAVIFLSNTVKEHSDNIRMYRVTPWQIECIEKNDCGEIDQAM